MWNILCDALYERQEYYKLTGRSLRMPEKVSTFPCRKTVLQFDTMRRAIVEMVWASCNPLYFGKFAPLGSFHKDLAGQLPDDDLFRDFGIDGHPLFLNESGYWHGVYGMSVPRWKYHAASFLESAAKIVNDVIRYPEPVFRLRAELEGEDADGKKYSGRWPEDGHLTVVKNKFTVTSSDLGAWERRTAKGRATGHRYFYPGAGEQRETGNSVYYNLPELQGSIPMRCTVNLLEMADWKELARETIEQSLTLSSATGETEKFSFGSWRSRADRLWNTDVSPDDFEYNRMWNIFIDNGNAISSPAEVFLSEENFKSLPYKYLE